MIDALNLGKSIVEDILREANGQIDPPGPCLYPGKFRPPHNGHFEAAKKLAALPYITHVIIIISSKVSSETGNITPEEALQIWKLYLNAQPNSKITVRISEHASPIVDMIHYINKYKDAERIYIAGGSEEKDDEQYMTNLESKYGEKVQSIEVNEKAGGISAPQVRELIQQGDYESFKQTIPVAAFNKGAAPKIWKLLTGTESNDQGQKTN